MGKIENTCLDSNESIYRYLFEKNPLPMLIYELETLHLLAVNDAFLAQYGYSKMEALALRLVDLYPENEKRPIADLSKKLRGRAYAGEWHHLKKDGTRITIEAYSHGMSYEGRAARIAVVTDISKRIRVEEDLQKSEELYRTLFENTGTASVLIEENTVISLANAEFERLSNMPSMRSRGKKVGRNSWSRKTWSECGPSIN